MLADAKATAKALEKEKKMTAAQKKKEERDDLKHQKEVEELKQETERMRIKVENEELQKNNPNLNLLKQIEQEQVEKERRQIREQEEAARRREEEADEDHMDEDEDYEDGPMPPADHRQMIVTPLFNHAELANTVMNNSAARIDVPVSSPNRDTLDRRSVSPRESGDANSRGLLRMC